MAKYLDETGLRTVLGKIDDTFARKGEWGAAATEAQGTEGEEGYVPASESTGIYKYVDDALSSSEAKITSDITVIGGPLADDSTDNWPTDAAWKVNGTRVIPEGTTLQELITKLFYSEKKGTLSGPTYTWSPSLKNVASVTGVTNGAHYPVGTELTLGLAANPGVSGDPATAKVTVTNGYGYSTDGTTIVSKSTSPATSTKSVSATAGTTSGTLVATATWGGDAVEDGDTLVVLAGDNVLATSQSGTVITPGTFSTTTVYNVSNTERVITAESKEISEAGFEASSAYAASKTLAARTETRTVVGYYPIFMGQLTTGNAPASTFTEAVIKAGAASEAMPAEIDIVQGTATMFIAVPQGNANYSKSGINVYNKKDDTAKYGASQIAGTVTLNEGGVAEKTYKVFFISNAAGWPETSTGFGIEFVA